MARRAAKADTNQREIVEGLRRVGATVQHLHTVGGGCPDILVGWRGRNYLIEIKDGSLAPSRRRLTDDEQEWHAGWKGCAIVAQSLSEALTAIGAAETNSWKPVGEAAANVIEQVKGRK